MDLKFRDLRADEIECRVNTVSENGCSLLLYKDARCDMKILDETVKASVFKSSYKKALKYAKYYNRISAFFDSKILSYYSEGIENLYYNNGKIRFIFSEIFSIKPLLYK